MIVFRGATDTSHIKTIRMHRTLSKHEFLGNFARELGISSWFGCNWDGFEEVLKSLEFMPEGQLEFFHGYYPFIVPVEDEDMYLAIISSAIEDWCREGLSNKIVIVASPSLNGEILKAGRERFLSR